MPSILIVGQKDSLLAFQIAQHLSSDLVSFWSQQFADAEISTTITEPQKIAHANILLVYQLHQAGNKCINDQVMELFVCVDQLKQLGAHNIKVLLPYLAYARQNEGLGTYKGAAFMIGRCLRTLGADIVYTCDIHAIDTSDLYPLTLHNLSLERFWAEVITKNIIADNDSSNFCIASPDQGGQERAQKIATLLGLSTAFIHKSRPTSDTAVCHEVIGNVHGKQVILVDDIIDTARTASSACNLLLEHGAEKVHGCFTHAILAKDAAQRLMTSKFNKIFITDTILSPKVSDGQRIQIVSLQEYLPLAIRDLVLQTSIF